jgi:hypothetical protein
LRGCFRPRSICNTSTRHAARYSICIYCRLSFPQFIPSGGLQLHVRSLRKFPLSYVGPAGLVSPLCPPTIVRHLRDCMALTALVHLASFPPRCPLIDSCSSCHLRLAPEIFLQFLNPSANMVIICLSPLTAMTPKLGTNSIRVGFT